MQHNAMATGGMGMMATGGMGMMAAGGTSTSGSVPDAGAKTFKLRIENTSTNSAIPTLVAPGAYAVVDDSSRPFTRDMMASAGLEKLAEDANPSVLAAELAGAAGVVSSGVFNMPVGASAAGPLNPGDAYELTFTAMPGERLHFASMFGQSNDTYFAATSGIVPTEAPRQPAPNTGPTESGVSLRTDGTRSIPIPSALVDVSVSLTGADYTVTLKNKSDQGPLMSPLSPVMS